MILTELKKPLSIDMVEFRIAREIQFKKNEGGKEIESMLINVLPYKNARVDMEVLDNAVGQFNWKREHTRDNKNCVVSIYDSDKKEWISKEDTGTESYADAQKGLASDSFKRACFNWGIGRELYSYPNITIFLNKGEFYNGKTNNQFKNDFRNWIWFSQFKEDKLSYLACKDSKGKARFKWGTYDENL